MGNVNSMADFIRGAFPSLVDKDGEIFKALLASGDPEKPGTLEDIFNRLEETRNEWCNTSNMYEQEGEMLEKTLSLFSLLSRVYGESDDSLKQRNRLLYARNGDTVWGSRWNIAKLFKAFFGSEFVYIVNNTDDVKNSLLSDGGFEANSGAWEFDSCGVSQAACFCGRAGLLLHGNGKCSQKVKVIPGSAYFLHFFHAGSVRVEIKDGSGRHWQPTAPCGDGFGSWVTQGAETGFTGKPGQWEAGSVFFIADESVSSATVSFMGTGKKTAFLDYARLFKKEAYPSFSLVAVFPGRYTPETMGLAPGTGDPIIARNYAGYKHFSGGTHDADRTDYGKLSFFDSAAVNEGKEPVLAEGRDDTGEITHFPNDGYIGDAPLAPWENDGPGVTVDYGKMSYIEQAHVFGAGGSTQYSLCAELLDIVKAGGIPSYIEILVKELDA